MTLLAEPSDEDGVATLTPSFSTASTLPLQGFFHGISVFCFFLQTSPNRTLIRAPEIFPQWQKFAEIFAVQVAENATVSLHRLVNIKRWHRQFKLCGVPDTSLSLNSAVSLTPLGHSSISIVVVAAQVLAVSLGAVAKNPVFHLGPILVCSLSVPGYCCGNGHYN